MISKEFYNFAIEADKKAENIGGCGTCFCWLFLNSLEDSNLKHFLSWKTENKVYTICGSVLFYLQDLGIIKIISGVTTRDNRASCKNLKYTIINNFQGNKI